MSTETISGPTGEGRVASTAGGGTALTTTAARIVLPIGTKQITLIPRNFSTAVVAQFLKNPYLAVLRTQDEGDSFQDYSYSAQDGSTGTSVILSSQDTLANGDALYVGSWVQFSGVDIDIDGTNSTGSVTLLVEYWNGGGWATVSATDGTASGGTTFAQDGNVTWTVPTQWKMGALKDMVKASALNTGPQLDLGAYLGLPAVPWLTDRLFWTRWSVDVAIDSSVTFDHMLAINRTTVYDELPSGTAHEEAVTFGPGGISCIQAKTDAGTANLVVKVAARGSEGRFA